MVLSSVASGLGWGCKETKRAWLGGSYRATTVGDALHRAPGGPRAAVWGVRRSFQTQCLSRRPLSALAPLALGMGRTGPEPRAQSPRCPCTCPLAAGRGHVGPSASLRLFTVGPGDFLECLLDPRTICSPWGVILCLRSHRGKDGFLLPKFTHGSGRTLIRKHIDLMGGAARGGPAGRGKAGGRMVGGRKHRGRGIFQGVTEAVCQILVDWAPLRKSRTLPGPPFPHP